MTSDLGVFIPGSKTGVLLLHDMGGAAAEMRPLAQAIARAGYTVSCPQLGSHLAGSTATGPNGPGLWLSEAEQALSRVKGRCESVVVLGSGYGAMLGLELARMNSEAVQALVLVEPKAWLPAIKGRLATKLAGLVPQVWLARVISAMPASWAPAAATSLLLPAAAATNGAPTTATRLIKEIALLLDCVQGALPSVMQPALLIQRQGGKRAGLDSSILLQQRLGGRVESIVIDDVGPSHQQVELTDTVAERAQRFVAAVFDEIETRRGNELRRQRVASARTGAA